MTEQNTAAPRDGAAENLTALSAEVRTDRRLQRALRRIKYAAVGVSLLLAAVFAVLMYAVWELMHSSYDDQIVNYAETCAVAVQRQAAGDLTALQTFSLLVTDGDSLTKSYMEHARSLSAFEVICYWGRDGRQTYLSISGITWDNADYPQTNPHQRAAVEAAWQGHSTVSEPFMSCSLKVPAVAFTVPIFNPEGRVIGALSAVRRLSVYEREIYGLTAPAGKVDLFLISKDGILMAQRSCQQHHLAPLTDCTQENLLPPADMELLQRDWTNDADMHAAFTSEGDTYHISSRPVGFGGWSVVTLSNFSAQASPYFVSLSTLAALITLVFVTALTVCFTAGGLISRNYRRQISLSFYDPLTGGCNLRRFALEISARSWCSPAYYLAAVNVRDFRFINEYAGTATADELLKTIYAQAKSTPEIMLICREQGDQFYFLLKVSRAAEIEKLILGLFERISTAFASKFGLFKVYLYAGVLPLNNIEQSENLLHRVKLVQRASRSGHDHVVTLYSAEIYQGLMAHRRCESELEPALASGQFKLYLQAKFDVAAQRICGAEALARWVLPDGTVRQPGEFIPLLEQAGLCDKLDLSMLEQVCRTLRSWIDEGLVPVRISVNQCRQLLFRGDYLDKVQALLTRYQVPAHLIVIEVLEHVMAQDLPRLNQYLMRLRALGVGIAIDDFGSGYSSLNMLSSLQVDEIKFDKGFMLESDAQKKDKNKLILKHFKGLAQLFEAATAVEGVECKEDADFLRAEGFNTAQGFYYGRPMAAAEFTRRFMHKA